MKILLVTTAASFLVLGATASADDPPADPPRTHVDTTVVDSTAKSDPGAAAPSSEIADNDRRFEAGAPGILKVTQRLHLSKQQQTQLQDAIERADAGAADLIKREHDIHEMIAATTPEDPLYAKLVSDQTENLARWHENREALRREVADLLTPAQRKRFEELRAQR